MFAAAGAGSAGIRLGGQALLRALPIEPFAAPDRVATVPQRAKKRKPKNAAAEAKLDSDC